MFIVIAVVAGIILLTALTVGIAPLFEIYHSNNSEVIAGEIAIIQEAVAQEAAENIDLLYRDGYAVPVVGGNRVNVNLPAYRHLYFASYDRYKYIETNFDHVSTEIDSKLVDSRRFAMWFESPFGNFLGDKYVVGEEFEAQNWQGDSKSLWAKLETHTSHYSLIQTEQQRLYRLSRKFYRYYEEVGTFQMLGESPSSGPLTSMVGLSSSDSCTGSHDLNGIPLGCQDMLNTWGEPIYLHVVNDSHIALTNSLGIKFKTGVQGAQPKYVGLAEEINIDDISDKAP